jgi:general secretion pathway protein N
MVGWLIILGLILLSGGALTAGPMSPAQAATSATLDILPDDTGLADAVDLGRVKPISKPSRDGGRPLPSGNPLWAIPLSVLTATPERPIFSATRRPPQRAVAAAPVDRVSAPPPPKAAAPERPTLVLIGAVVGESDAIAVFLDQTNQKIVRLHQGESHAGWELSSVQPREVTLRKADRTEVLALKRQDGPAGVADAPAAPRLVVPAAAGGNTSYAPFLPALRRRTHSRTDSKVRSRCGDPRRGRGLWSRYSVWPTSVVVPDRWS